LSKNVFGIWFGLSGINILPMINQFEVPMYLEEALPDISIALNKTNSPTNIYKSVQALLDYTFQQIKAHNFATLKKCFVLADKLYRNGNNIVRSAIENVLVFSFSRLPAQDVQEKNHVMGLIPGSLYSVYMHQVHCCGK
jgi:hypothetical protein